jgi:hypothetical protein
VSERFKQLSARHQALRARSQAQRQELAALSQDLELRLEKIDRGVATVRRLAKNPVVLIGAAAVIALVGPRRLLHLASRAVYLTGAVGPLLRLKDRL